jgi:hypothetical protein
MMAPITLLALLLTAAHANAAPQSAPQATPSAAASERVTYQFGDGQVEFVRDRAHALTVSASCLGKAGQDKCQALQAFERVRYDWLPKSAKGRRPDFIRQKTQLCEIAGGRRIIGFLQSGGENSFCGFKDQSLIDLGSLWSAATQN